MKLKVPTSNLVKFDITRARFDINKYQDSRNFTQNLKMCAREKTFRDMDGILKKFNYIHVCVCVHARVGRRKKKNELAFQRERRSIQSEEEKNNSSKENF